MAAPWHEAKPLVASHGLVALSGNYALYGDLSGRVMSVLADMAPRQEIYSIDEAFLDFTGLPEPEVLAQAMRRRVLQWTHIPTCVGIGSTKTRAKLANLLAKREPAHQGVFNLENLTPAEELALFRQLPVACIWGVGRRLTDKLERLRILTVADLQRAEPDFLRKHFSVVLARTAMELQGVSCLSIDELAEPQKQVLHSRSFGRRVTNLSDLEEAVQEFITAAAAKLRQRGLQTALVGISIRTNHTRQQDAQYSNSITLPLAAPTQDTGVLAHLAREGLRRIYRPGYRYKKAGVLLTALSGQEQCQLDWLDPGDSLRSRALMSVVDRINRDMGRDTLRWGLPSHPENWQMWRDLRSPRFTSRWDELVRVRA